MTWQRNSIRIKFWLHPRQDPETSWTKSPYPTSS